MECLVDGSDPSFISHVVTAVLAAAISALCVILVQLKTSASASEGRGKKVHSGQEKEPASRGAASEAERRRVRVGEEEEVLLREQCTRNIQFLGEERFQRLRESFVVVVGIGGTGSHAAHMLARSGVGRLRLVDFDQVTLSSLNRHAVATRADVGKSKADVMRAHLLETVPGLDCDVVNVALEMSNCPQVLAGKPDLVIDCIDNVPSKTELLAHCVQNKIQVLCCAGAGCRADPTRLRIADISETENDGLLRHTRYELSKRFRVRRGVTCLFSVEKPVQQLLPLNECQEEDPSAFQAMPSLAMRVRIVPVLGPLPALFGNALAMHAITMITGLPGVRPMGTTPTGKKAFDKLLFQMRRDEKQYFPDQPLCPEELWVSSDDIRVVAEDIFGGRSAFSGTTSSKSSKMRVVRWDKEKRPAVDNLVLLTASEVGRHFSAPGWEAWPESFVAAVSESLQSGSAFKRQENWE